MTTAPTITITPGSPLAVAIANLPMKAEVIDDVRQALDIDFDKRHSIENSVAILHASLDHGLMSARLAARHTGLTIEDLQDIFKSYGLSNPIDL